MYGKKYLLREENLNRLTNKVALITGSASGIGKASALLFASEGATLGLMDIDEINGKAVAQTINSNGGNAKFIHTDVSNGDNLKFSIHSFAKEFSGIDILYNNAGGATAEDDHLLKMPMTEFNHAIGLNLFGPFAACRFAIPHMEERGGGSIINTASIRSQIGTPGADGYTAAKGGIVSLTRALAVQCAKKRIRVNAIAPGAVLTERVQALIEQGNDSGPTKDLVKRHLLGLGKPDQIANVALFFASQDAEWVTGQILPVDGGASAN